MITEIIKDILDNFVILINTTKLQKNYLLLQYEYHTQVKIPNIKIGVAIPI